MSEPRFNMHYGTPAVLIGWLVTFVVFCVGYTASVVFSGYDSAMGWYLLPISLMYGFPVAVAVGLPLGLFIAWPLRRVRNQWIHVLAFAVGIGLATALSMLLIGGVEAVRQSTVTILAVALSAAIGRASVMRLVARKNALVNQSNPAMRARYGL
ncbi:hypothetical protein [Arthrobacter alpinus]|nr:hypothetical protein [Arthrobacter alpinus]